MPRFVFLAKSMSGEELRGELEAQSESEARVRIRAKKLVPLKIVEKGKRKPKVSRGSVKPKELQIFTRQLATLVSSGIPIMQAVEALARSAKSPNLHAAANHVMNDISQGKRLGEALKRHPRIFDSLYCNLVSAGEESGNLDEILNRLAQYIEKSVKIQNRIKGAMFYPAAIIFVSIGVIIFLLVFVIPQLEQLFSQSGSELPGITQMVIGMSEFMQSNWYFVIGGMILSVIGLKKFRETESGKKIIDAQLIRIPVLGDIIIKGGIARFSRTFSTLLSSGVNIIEALELSASVTGNHVLENAIKKSKESITEGKSLTVPLARERLVPSMVTQMIGIGESTGELDSMLSKVADFFEEEVDVAVSAMMSLMEPVIMVFLGGVVGFLLIAMYLPILTLASNV